MSKRIAIFGASGFIGSSIFEYLSNFEDIVVIPLRAPRFQLSPRSAIEEIDIEPHTAVVAEISEALSDVDVVINSAGLATPSATASADLFGANALLPRILFEASRIADVNRFIHLSSAAVQGSKRVIDASPETAPFSPYSESKALGEALLLKVRDSAQMQTTIVRATSVQGKDRDTTKALQRFASSWYATVASPGNQPSIVSTVEGLTTFVSGLALSQSKTLPNIVVQPWEGLSVSDVIQAYGGKDPIVLPRWFCLSGLKIGSIVSKFAGGRFDALLRRVEVAWFGQDQIETRLDWLNSED